MYGYNNYYQSPYQSQYGQQAQPQGYTQLPYQQQAVQQYIKGRPVSSAEEAKASMIDLDGSLFVFPDVKNKLIYTKQIMLDGTAEFHTYRLVPETKQNAQEQNTINNQYVLDSDFRAVVGELNRKIELLKNGGVVNEYATESTGNVTDSKQK